MRNSMLGIAMLVLPLTAAAQSGGAVKQSGSAADRRELVFEISAGAGVTTVDVEKWGGTGVRAEELLLSQADLRLFFHRAGGFQLGLEGGYRYFFYYEVPYPPFGFLGRDVSATRIGAVARRALNGVVSFDVGPAVYMFDGFTDFGASGAVVFRIPAGKIGIPLHLRTDVVFDEQLMIGSGATIGVSIKR